MKYIPYLQNFEWQPAIESKDQTSPPSGYSKGDRYIVASGATGDWVGQDDNIALYNTTWEFISKKEGMITWIKDEQKYFYYNGTSWVELANDKANITEVVNLDQTTPQTIINGIPLLEQNREISEIHQLTDKKYVDRAALGTGLRFYLLDEDSLIDDPDKALGEKYLTACSTGCPETPFTLVFNDVTTGQYLDGWVTGGLFTEEGPFTIVEGIYSLHLFTKQSGTKNCTLQWKLYLYDPAQDPGEEETLLGVSSTTDNLSNAKTLYHLPLFLEEDVVIPQDGRIIGKLFVVESDSPAPDITIYGGGDDKSYLEAPSNVEILDTLYEKLSNKVTSFQATPDDTSYPSEKLVKDSLDDKVDKETGKSLVDDTEIAKIHEHDNKTELDKVTDGDHDVVTGNPHGTTADEINTDEAGKTVQDKLDEAVDIVEDTTPELGGDLNTNEKDIQLIAALSSDHITSGLTVSDTVGENVAIGDVLYMKSDGKYWLADAEASTTMPGVVIATESINADASGKLMHRGYIRDDTWDWTIGGLIYVTTTGTTGNTLTQTAPSGTGDQVQIVGYAVTADIMWFEPNLMLIKVA